jgi:hypothetical protein
MDQAGGVEKEEKKNSGVLTPKIRQSFVSLNAEGIIFTLWKFMVSRYSYWLRTGRSRDRILVGARFFAHVQNGPGPTQPSVQWVPGFFPGVESGQDVV